MYRFAINRPITTLMIFMSLVVFGVMSLQRMPVNLFPEIEIPLIKITTYASGDMNLIESKVTKKIEDEISTIDGIDKIHSYSYNNLSVVLIQFDLEKDINVAADDVRDKVSKAGVEGRSEIEKIKGTGDRILNIFVSSKSGDEVALMKLVDEKVKPFLQRIDGIGKVGDVGFLEPQVKIYLDPFKLDKFRLNANDIANLIKTQNLKAPLGKLESANSQLFLKSSFDAKSIEELKELRLASGVFLKDVARIELDKQDTDSIAVMNGKQGVMLELLKISGVNALATIENVKSKIDELSQIVGEEYELKIAFDNSENITKHIGQVGFDMVLGVVLTIFIVFFFLRNFSSTVISALSIPTSIIGTFFIIDMLGFDLNRLTLIALTLGIGIFIDDAIVVIENISKKMQEGETNPLKASFAGVGEITFSVLSISAVLLCVFVPIAFMEGIVGRYFNSFAMSVAGGIAVSFFVSIMLIPSLGARFLNAQEGKFFHLTEPFFVALENGYAWLLAIILKFKTLFVVLSLALLALCMSLAMKVGMDFMPIEDNGEFEIFIKAQPGISLVAMSEKSSVVLDELNKDPRVDYAYMLVGYTDAKDAFKAKIYAKLKDIKERKDRQPQIMEEYRKKLKIDGLNIKISALPMVDAGGANEPVQLVITGDSLEKLDEILSQARKILESVSGVVDISSDNEDRINQLEISVNKEKAKRLGISQYDITRVVYGSFGQNFLGSFDDGNDQYDIMLRFDDEYRKDITSLEKLHIRSASGEAIALNSVANFKLTKTFSSIMRFNKQRQILIVANVDNIPLDNVQKVVDEQIPSILPKGYDYRMTGFIELMNDTNEAFIFTISLSVILIYMILAALYESLIMPFIIMISMPLAFGGVAVGLYLSGNSFSLFVMVGAILLFGMVGKNAILVVDFANRYANEGMNVNEAIIKAGSKRLRAILMTTFAMIFAMLPLALSRGAGYEGNSPMAISIISGLISSTILTLFLVPALFGITYKIDKFIGKIYKRDQI
ncbi:efflux RND transporter permease subunit [Campylobacter sp. RM16187]|uniref:efflux RND transporter permease subunit n=1 Tax=Campylobacter sp. RM16187 TaxID=1660063 RepID=UPI0021B60007|nr:efflux RND transporter permease subunit [Campylobacter sp. RM16187]QKG29244.1 RND family efflux transporter, membrane subunit [Campylobacter sp. RM16187]